MNKTENEFSGVGACALSKALEVNTTLTELELYCEPEQRNKANNDTTSSKNEGKQQATHLVQRECAHWARH